MDIVDLIKTVSIKPKLVISPSHEIVRNVVTAEGRWWMITRQSRSNLAEASKAMVNPRLNRHDLLLIGEALTI